LRARIVTFSKESISPHSPFIPLNKSQKFVKKKIEVDKKDFPLPTFTFEWVIREGEAYRDVEGVDS